MKAHLKIHGGEKTDICKHTYKHKYKHKKRNMLELNKLNQSTTNKENYLQENMNSEEGELNGDLEEGEL